MDTHARGRRRAAGRWRGGRWYRRLLGLRLWTEIVEDGVVRGAGLIDPQGRFGIALRDRSVCASTPDLRGFDVVAFRPESRAELEQLAARCTGLGIAHDGIRVTPGGELLDVPDPDGTVVRFYHFTAPTDGFTGVEFRNGAFVGTHRRSTLDEPTEIDAGVDGPRGGGASLSPPGADVVVDGWARLRGREGVADLDEVAVGVADVDRQKR